MVHSEELLATNFRHKFPSQMQLSLFDDIFNVEYLRVPLIFIKSSFYLRTISTRINLQPVHEITNKLILKLKLKYYEPFILRGTADYRQKLSTLLSCCTPRDSSDVTVGLADSPLIPALSTSLKKKRKTGQKINTTRISAESTAPALAPTPIRKIGVGARPNDPVYIRLMWNGG